MSVLSKSERVFYITQTLEMEVNSGGFSQFFYNFRGNFTNRLIGAFSEIGAQATAAICQKAIAALGCDIPVDRDGLNALNYVYIMQNKTYLTELCRCELMRRIVWKCGNFMGGLLWVSSPPFIKTLVKYRWYARCMSGTMGAEI